MKIIVEKKKKKKIVIVKNNIAIRIAGKVSRYIDASMNRATHRHNYTKNMWRSAIAIFIKSWIQVQHVLCINANYIHKLIGFIHHTVNNQLEQ